MKMEIEFRGKTAKGEWVYGYHAKFRNYKNEVYSTIIPKDEETDEAYMEDLHPVIPETVGQYTGIKDKNGKKIFEGDILKVWYSSVENVGFFENLEVYYNEEYAQYFAGHRDLYEVASSSEVIGNIFDKESDDGRED